MPAPYEITPAQLHRLVGTLDAPLLVDLRTDEDFADDPRLVPGAWRHPWRAWEALAPRIGTRRAVVYCQKGRKISQGAAAGLRAMGVRAEVLEGGQFAWRDGDRPSVDASVHPALGEPEAKSTLWVTRHRPKVDRIACPWLLRRWIDPRARVLFVPPSDVAAVAERFEATPFDTEDGPWRHEGESCTFDAMLAGFGLRDPALDAVAAVVRAADTGRLDTVPEAAGLLALSLGLSRVYRDDHAQLEAGLAVYDALFRWARDARDETHAHALPAAEAV